MGIVNLTGDSFFAPSRAQTVKDALQMAETLLSEGADILDFGAASSRPGAEDIGAAAELDRLIPVLKEVKTAFPSCRISVDSYHSQVVTRLYDEIGPFMVNDISAGRLDPAMLPAAGRLKLPYVAMHMRGTPETMQTLTDYGNDIVTEVSDYFRNFSERASEYGIDDWILDPGFGFAKTAGQNFELLSGLGRLTGHGRRILVGVSRKSMIYKYFNISPEEALPQTQVLHLIALQNGADILRVHDVAEAARTVEIYRRTAR